MAKGKTLWEMLLAKFQGSVELQFYNPLKAKIGSSLTINDIDWRDLNFFVQEIREYRRTIGPTQFLFVDYVLLARPLEKEAVTVRLRLNPVENPDTAGGLTHDVLLLRLYDDLAYNEALHKVVTDQTKRFQILENGQVKEEYWRINDVTDSYMSKVSVVKDANHDDEVEKDEVEKVNLEYWDYWREVNDEAGQPMKQFLFVEMDTDNGWIQIWRGQAIDPQLVLVI